MALAAVSRARMQKDYRELEKAPPEGIAAWYPDATKISIVDCSLMGPDGTPYAGGLFHLRATFPDRYPHEPPNLKFKTPVYHPNVSHDGNICCSVLNMPPKGDWKPSNSLRTVLLSIQLLLQAPNPDDPLDGDAARELLANEQLFRHKAAECTRLHANPDAGRSGAAASSGGGGAAVAAAQAAPARAPPQASAPAASAAASGIPAPAAAAQGVPTEGQAATQSDQGTRRQCGEVQGQGQEDAPAAPQARAEGGQAQTPGGPALASAPDQPGQGSSPGAAGLNACSAAKGDGQGPVAAGPAGGVDAEAVKRPAADPPRSRLALGKRAKS
ncbi:hypothetical protein HYH03_006687 [Edaphochlamys debaryana]|uniref:UBC core domain-containing protein n=1 Tax=Edaphochlamys debaryana TaxID=47281 RepID=A0A835Y346_9CHLO|nr:hypothetical protein HYH03_006687 [Edaphochlamys debaryana]|eukprot:KAG2495076.1 hypothetical protein HYH03_006687 [Edaphochlamys debaryana]